MNLSPIYQNHHENTECRIMKDGSQKIFVRPSLQERQSSLYGAVEYNNL